MFCPNIQFDNTIIMLSDEKKLSWKVGGHENSKSSRKLVTGRFQ